MKNKEKIKKDFIFFLFFQKNKNYYKKKFAKNQKNILYTYLKSKGKKYHTLNPKTNLLLM